MIATDKAVPEKPEAHERACDVPTERWREGISRWYVPSSDADRKEWLPDHWRQFTIVCQAKSHHLFMRPDGLWTDTEWVAKMDIEKRKDDPVPAVLTEPTWIKAGRKRPLLLKGPEEPDAKKPWNHNGEYVDTLKARIE